MNKPHSYDLTITFIDGHRRSFKIPPQVDSIKMNHFIERLLIAPTLSLQSDDTLLVIPTVNIRNAEIHPVPEKLPEVVLHNVQFGAE